MNKAETDQALLAVLEHLAVFDYRFITPTPETHRRVVSRGANPPARDLRGIFGWSLPFPEELLPSALFERLSSAALLEVEGNLYKSAVRVSSIGDRLFLHSAYPTDEPDSVFFGPDTYRFARFLEAEIEEGAPVRRLVDIGAGSGAGAILAAARLPRARLTLTDINPLALRFARLNARHAGLDVELVESSGIDGMAGPFDLAIANPPFLVDAAMRTYRDGGGLHGAALSLAWAGASARRLEPGGRMLLYSGSAIIDGQDRLERALREMVTEQGCSLRYAEIDPDVFGDQLDQPHYEHIERIAAVGAVIEKPA